MKIEIKIDPSLSEPRLVITAPVLTHDLEQLIAQLSENKPNFIAGFREEGMELLDPGEIYRFYSSGTKICAETVNGEYIVRLRMYEPELRLGNNFIRISQSEIINLTHTQHFDLSFSGTICVTLSNGSTTYVSRRYVSKIKQAIGI